MSPVPPVAAIRETSGTILDPPGTCLCSRHSESDVSRHSGPVPVMNTSPRRLAISIGIALSALATGACGDDAEPAEVADALAQDSTLELTIYGAVSDSAPSPADSADSTLANDGDAAGPALPRSRSDTATPSRSADSTATTQRTAARDDEARPAVVAQRVSSRVNATGARPVIQRAPSQPRDADVSPGAGRRRRIAAARTEARTSRRQATTSRATRPSRESARTTRRESLQLANTSGREIDFPAKRMGGTALVPAGTSLSLAAAKQICILPTPYSSKPLFRCLLERTRSPLPRARGRRHTSSRTFRQFVPLPDFKSFSAAWMRRARSGRSRNATKSAKVGSRPSGNRSTAFLISRRSCVVLIAFPTE